MDFKDSTYGFRPNRSVKQALEVVKKACNNKSYYVVNTDIHSFFFDNVNQEKLMKLVEQMISDRRILKLIGQWLKAGVLYGNILESPFYLIVKNNKDINGILTQKVNLHTI